MFKQIKEFFTGKSVEVQAAAPYKVEAPIAPTPVAEQATLAVVESIAPAKKVPAKKAAAAKKPRAPKAAK